MQSDLHALVLGHKLDIFSNRSFCISDSEISVTGEMFIIEELINWSSFVNNCFKGHLLTTGLFLTKLRVNDPLMALFNYCSNGLTLLHI